MLSVEQWRDQAALDAHLAHLVRLLGPPPPAGRLPAALLEVCEKTRAVRYDVTLQGRNHLFLGTEPAFGQFLEHTRAFLATR